MGIDNIIAQLEEASGTQKHQEILQTLTDDDLRKIIDKKYARKPSHIKAIIFQGYKKQQMG